LVGIISILLSASGERLGDHVAGTIVLGLDRPETAAKNLRPEAGAGLILTRARLARIGPREIRLIRGVLRRPSTLGSDRRRQVLVGGAAEAMRLRLDLAELPNSDSVDVLRNALKAAERFGGSD